RIRQHHVLARPERLEAGLFGGLRQACGGPGLDRRVGVDGKQPEVNCPLSPRRSLETLPYTSPAVHRGTIRPSMGPASVVLIDEPSAGVRRFTLNRPEKRNALNNELRGAILTGLQAADADPSIKVSILRGAGPCFSSGY